MENTIGYELDIVKNVNPDSEHFGETGIILQANSKSGYVMYFKYNKAKARTVETDSAWELFKNIEVKTSLGQVIDLLSKKVSPAAAKAELATTTDTTSEEPAEAEEPIEEPALQRKPRKPRTPNLEAVQKKAAVIDMMSNDQILSYDESKITAADNEFIKKLQNDLQYAQDRSKRYGYSVSDPDKLMAGHMYNQSPSCVVFTGNGKYKRNVLQAAALAAGGNPIPQVKSYHSSRNVLVVSGADKEKESTKMRLAKERGWSIISEDGFLKVLSLSSPQVVDEIVAAMKKAMKEPRM